MTYPSQVPLDRLVSPRTGWTRAHWEGLADHLLHSLTPYASPSFAQYRLPGRHSVSGVASDGLEGYARSFLLAAFRIAGARGEVDSSLIERYAAGLAAGTNPASNEAWLPITDGSQPMVEAASIAIALHETKPWIWDQLDGAIQQRVADWLGGFISAKPWNNNWRLFQVVAEQFLKSVGADYSQDDIDGGLDVIEDWYVGDGWYSDGSGQKFDYYIGWAMHLYPLLWARMAGDDDNGLAAAYRDRLSTFLETYPQFFGTDGAPVFQGRSLTYRFASVAPVWMGALAGCTPLLPGQTRRLASSVVRHFVERGVPDGNGLLSLGWYEPNLSMTQVYSGPASPYWASKGFLGLLIPPDDPVWTDREALLPLDTGDQYTALQAPSWLLHGTTHDGIVRLVNHGSDHMGYEPEPEGDDDPHYAKLAYSSATAPETAPRAWQSNIDNHIALIAPDGTASRRRRIHRLSCTDRQASSWHAARLPGDDTDHRIESTSLLYGPWEIRVHRVDAPAGVTVREGGHAVAASAQPTVSTGSSQSAGWAEACGDGGLTSAVVGLHGWDEVGAAREVDVNAFGPHSATPFVQRESHDGGRAVYVTLIALARDTVNAQALAEAITVDVTTPEEVIIRFPDGHTERHLFTGA